LYANVGRSADKEGCSCAEHGFRIQLIGQSQSRPKPKFIAIEKIIPATAGRPVGDAPEASTVLRIRHAGVEKPITAILLFPSGGVIVAKPVIERNLARDLPTVLSVKPELVFPEPGDRRGVDLVVID
jgi:hypothetical protein